MTTARLAAAKISTGSHPKMAAGTPMMNTSHTRRVNGPHIAQPSHPPAMSSSSLITSS